MDLLDRLSLDVPVGQAGMGGGIAGPELAAAVAEAGGLGTLGLAPAAELRGSIARVRDVAPGRAIAVNLLTPFPRRSHVSGWPAPHRVIANAATERWCHPDGTPKAVARAMTRGSAMLAKLPATTAALKLQNPRLPMFSPIAPTAGMPASAVDRAACYAGESALRMTSITSARQAVSELTPGGQWKHERGPLL